MGVKISGLIWDDWNVEHIAEHGVEPYEVQEVINSRTFQAQRRGDVYQVFGQTEDGRYLFAVLSPRSEQRFYIVTARDMTEREKQSYRQRRR